VVVEDLNVFRKRKPAISPESEAKTSDLERKVNEITERVRRFVAEPQVMTITSEPGANRPKPRNGKV
jgi:hypothetical protein